MVELAPDPQAGQSGPAGASYWPVAVCPSSPAAGLLSDEAAVQPEMMAAHLDPRSQRVVPQLHGCCL